MKEAGRGHGGQGPQVFSHPKVCAGLAWVLGLPALLTLFTHLFPLAFNGQRAFFLQRGGASWKAYSAAFFRINAGLAFVLNYS